MAWFILGFYSKRSLNVKQFAKHRNLKLWICFLHHTTSWNVYIHDTACLFPYTIGFYLKSPVFGRGFKDVIKKLDMEINRNCEGKI